MSAAAPIMQSVTAAPAQYVYASPAGYQGAGVPMEPVAGQPMAAGVPQVTTYQTMGASSALQAGGQVMYGAPQVVSQAQPVYVQQPGQDGQTVTYVTQPPQEAQTVTYLTQPAQEMQAAPAQYITAAPQYVQAAQYQAPGQPYAFAQGATPYANFPSAPSMVAYPGAPVNYFPMSVQQAWDNHFSAFGAKDVEKILLDYDETSVIRVYTNPAGQLAEFHGTAQIRDFFSGVFRDLYDMSTLDAPVQVVEEDHKQVFLVWKCPSSGIALASDTFIFGLDNKIKRQNITLDKQAGFVAHAGASATSGRMGASAAAGSPSSPISSAKASEKKGSKKKLGSKKKAKSGFC